MLATLEGIDIELTPVQPSNAELPMLVTPFGIIVSLHPKTKVFVEVSMIALQLFLLSYVLLPLETTIELKLVQP